MSTYAIGDIQGCFRSLQKLLETIAFDPRRDRLWLVGDMVNGGPRSLEVLRWARGLGDRVTAVLGNHDLHLLARAAGVAPPRRRDTLEAVLLAPDRDELLQWLGRRPLLHREGDYCLIHGGVAPEWELSQIGELAREAEEELQGGRRTDAFMAIYAGKPERWDPKTSGLQRVRDIVRIFTQVRVCSVDGRLDFGFKGPPEAAPAGFLPWFQIPGRRSAAATFVFGHWAALGFRLMPGAWAIDSGCVWGKSLTALRLEDQKVFQAPCLDLTTS